MLQTSFIENDKFWQTLCYLEKLTKKVSTRSLCKELEITPALLNMVVSFLSNLNLNYQLMKEEGGDILVPPINKPKIRLDLSLSEWLSLQAHFPVMEEYGGMAFHDSLAKRLSIVERENDKYDLFNATICTSYELDDPYGDSNKKSSSSDQQFIENLSDHVQMISSIIGLKKLAKINLNGGKKLLIYPHRLVHLEGNLCVIAEDTTDSCLIYCNTCDIKTVSVCDCGDYQVNVSNVEVNDFVEGLRKVNDTEVRLILKIQNDTAGELVPPHHFFGNPYVSTNTQGEIIWAATVEPCEDLFSWLYALGDQVKIIDPESFKKQYLDYCQQKLKKAA